MFAFIMRRLGTLSVILFGSSFLLYNLAALSGDPLAELRTSRALNAPQQIIALTRKLQLDVPPPLRYFYWLRGLFGVFVGKFDLGQTRGSESVGSAIASAVPTTLRLVTTATVTAIILGISIGIVTALRQYSKFDYSMTFVSFLLFSLPIFWVAVLLKQFMAIGFNNWLGEPSIPIKTVVLIGIILGLIIASVAGGDRAKSWKIFGISAFSTMLVLEVLVKINWFLQPGLGPVFYLLGSVGIAFGVTHLSMGISNRVALISSLTVAGIAFVLYFPMQKVFEMQKQGLLLVAAAALTILIAIGVALYFAKIDR
ncbi:MAG: hypothetical protein F2888_03165, partial [Actinobacteria bacterium]|nr:hypothetical protein [Actinomycetota bacterium]